MGGNEMVVKLISLASLFWNKDHLTWPSSWSDLIRAQKEVDKGCFVSKAIDVLPTKELLFLSESYLGHLYSQVNVGMLAM